MTEGTAKVKKLNYKKAAQNMKTAVDKKGNVVIPVPLPEKNLYLVITIPKEAVQDKVNELHAAGLDKKQRAKELSKWVKENRKTAIDKYLETKKTSIEFTISVKGVVPTPVKPTKTPKKAPSVYDIMAKKGIEEKKVKSPISISSGGSTSGGSGGGSKAVNKMLGEGGVITITTKGAGKFKDYQSLRTFYFGKKPGFGAEVYKLSSFSLTYAVEGKKSKKYSFALFVAVPDFTSAVKGIDISQINKKQKNKVINQVTEKLFKNLQAELKKKGVSLSADDIPVVKKMIMEKVTNMVEGIVKSKKKAVVLSG